MKTWHHPQNWKYITHRNTATGLSHDHQHPRKLGKCWTYGFWDNARGQKDIQTRRLQCFALLHGRSYRPKCAKVKRLLVLINSDWLSIQSHDCKQRSSPLHSLNNYLCRLDSILSACVHQRVNLQASEQSSQNTCICRTLECIIGQNVAATWTNWIYYSDLFPLMVD